MAPNLRFNAAKRGGRADERTSRDPFWEKRKRRCSPPKAAHHPRPSSVTNGGGQQHLRPDEPRARPMERERVTEAEGQSSDRPPKCRGPVPTFRPYPSTGAHANVPPPFSVPRRSRAAAEGNLCSYRARAGGGGARFQESKQFVGGACGCGIVDVVWIDRCTWKGAVR